MRVYLNSNHVRILKRRALEAMPNVSASCRVEALARGLGFNTYAGLRSALNAGSVLAEIDEKAFTEHLHRKGTQVGPRVLQRVIIRTLLEPIIEANPWLTTHGFGVPRHRYSTAEAFREEMESSRQEFSKDKTCDQFELALIMLQRCERRKTLNRDFHTYNLKHTAENLSREMEFRTELDNYISNGVFIAAALYEGFEVRRISWDSLSGYLNISSKSVKLFQDANSVRRLLGEDQPIAA